MVLVLILFALVINIVTYYYLKHQVEPKERCISQLLALQTSSYENEIPIVAVTNDGRGVVGYLHLKLVPGNGEILVNANPFVEPDIQYSLQKAVNYAKQYTHLEHSSMDFIFSYNISGAQLIGGESAGAASTILAIATLLNKSIKKDAVITGVIYPDGTIGRVGGIMEKAYAVAKAGYKYFLIPKGQSRIVYYEKVTKKEPLGYGFYLYNTYYVPHVIDLKEVAKKEWNLTVVEVSNIQEALPYFID